MAKDNLRQALEQAGIQPDELAETVQVDPRSVRRWLSGVTPRPRQRAKIARALDTSESDLWPEVAIKAAKPPAQRRDPIAAYPTVSDLDAPDWKTLLQEATRRIELLGETLNPILDTHGAQDTLLAKAANDCHIRLLLAHPDASLAPLANQPGIEIRILNTPPRHTLYRFDDQLLLTIHLQDRPGDPGALLHIRRVTSDGIFDLLTDHFNHLWEEDAQPIRPDLESCRGAGENREAAGESAATQARGNRAEAATRAPRHWPRRPG